MTLDAHRARVTAMVRDDVGIISDDDALDAIVHAVARYSAHRPRRLVADLDAVTDGVVSRDLASGLANWDDDISYMRTVEHPIDKVPPVYVGHETYLATGGTRRLYAPDIGAGETVRVSYTAAHVVDGSTDTTPDADAEAIASWAAARLLEELAARAAGVTDSTIGADAVDHDRPARDYQALARGYRNRFYELLGIDREGEMRTPGASATVQLESRRLSTGSRRLTHFRPGV